MDKFWQISINTDKISIICWCLEQLVSGCSPLPKEHTFFKSGIRLGKTSTQIFHFVWSALEWIPGSNIQVWPFVSGSGNRSCQDRTASALNSVHFIESDSRSVGILLNSRSTLLTGWIYDPHDFKISAFWLSNILEIKFHINFKGIRTRNCPLDELRTSFLEHSALISHFRYISTLQTNKTIRHATNGQHFDINVHLEYEYEYSGWNKLRDHLPRVWTNRVIRTQWSKNEWTS